MKREFVWITPGAIAATALWLIVSLGFKWYAFHVGDYQKTYGAIGGVMVALLWFYFSGLAILLGAQLDATIDHIVSRPVRQRASQGGKSSLIAVRHVSRPAAGRAHRRANGTRVRF